MDIGVNLTDTIWADKHEQLRVHRRAGVLEQYHIVKQVLGLDSCVVLTARLVQPASSSTSTALEGIKTHLLTKERVYKAVAHALRTHAELSARIRLDTAKDTSVYECLGTVELNDIVRFHNSSDVVKDGAVGSDVHDVAASLEKELLEPLDAQSDTPLWRMTVFPSPRNTIVLAWHHAIGDGQSGLAILQTLLDSLNAHARGNTGEREEAASVVRIPRDLEMTPALEDLTPTPVSFLTFLKELVGIIVPKAWMHPVGLWTGNPIITHKRGDAVVKTNVKAFSVPPASSARLLQACRAHRATITGALYILTHVALSRALQSASAPGASPWTTISTNIPVSLRALSRPVIPRTAMAELVSSYHSSSPLLQTFSWEDAAAFTKELHAAVPGTRESIGMMILLIRYLSGKFEPYFNGQMGKPRDRSFALSNIGVADVSASRSTTPLETQGARKGDEWGVADVYFAQADCAGAAFKVNVVGSPDGALNTCVTWGAGSLDDGIAETVVRELQAAIDELLASI